MSLLAPCAWFRVAAVIIVVDSLQNLGSVPASPPAASCDWMEKGFLQLFLTAGLSLQPTKSTFPLPHCALFWNLFPQKTTTFLSQGLLGGNLNLDGSTTGEKQEQKIYLRCREAADACSRTTKQGLSPPRGTFQSLGPTVQMGGVPIPMVSEGT